MATSPMLAGAWGSQAWVSEGKPFCLSLPLPPTLEGGLGAATYFLPESQLQPGQLSHGATCQGQSSLHHTLDHGGGRGNQWKQKY